MPPIPGIPGNGLSDSVKSKRRRLASLCEAQGHRCCYCGRRFGEHGPGSAATEEHVIPRSWGGGNKWRNVVAACSRCNNLRGNRDAIEFFNARSWERGEAWRPARAPLGNFLDRERFRALTP